MNSLFGTSDNKYFRLSEEGLGGAITAGSRYVTWKGTEIIREMGHNVVYGDTDSVFVQLGDPSKDSLEDVISNGERIVSTLNESMDEVADDFGLPDQHPFLEGAELHGTDKQCFEWDFETILRRFLQTNRKKRYAGKRIMQDGEVLDEPSYKIKGYETRRSDLPAIGAEVQREVLQRILDGDGFDAISGYLRAIVEDIRTGNIGLDRIAIPGSLNKQPEEYPNMPVPRACLYANDYIEGLWWSEGDSPWVCYVKSVPNDKPITDVIAVPWNVDSLPEGYELDVETHIEKFVEGPLEPILDELGWKFSELSSGKRTNTIDLGGSSSGDSDPFAS
jgi:DNA polymerase elongation subunit (family B)